MTVAAGDGYEEFEGDDPDEAEAVLRDHGYTEESLCDVGRTLQRWFARQSHPDHPLCLVPQSGELLGAKDMVGELARWHPRRRSRAQLWLGALAPGRSTADRLESSRRASQAVATAKKRVTCRRTASGASSGRK